MGGCQSVTVTFLFTNAVPVVEDAGKDPEPVPDSDEDPEPIFAHAAPGTENGLSPKAATISGTPAVPMP
jgi:hypothetical protein